MNWIRIKMNTRLEDGWIFKWAELHEWTENALTNF